MSEAGQQKGVVLLEVEPGGKAAHKFIPLSSGKKLHRQAFDSVDKAVEWLSSHPHSLVELTLISDNFLISAERKRIYDAHDGIVALIPKITNPELLSGAASEVDLSRDIEELFVDYFQPQTWPGSQ